VRGRVLVLVLGAVVVLAGCRGNVFDLAVGTCFDAPAGGEELTDVPVVDCGDPHVNEVYATFLLDEGEFPGDEVVAELARSGCLDRFQEWAGVAYADSRLVARYFAPTRSSWEEVEDREVACYVFDISGEPMVGSMEGTGV
jgi:hypothetical protein